jgi:hypothetical protein
MTKKHFIRLAEYIRDSKQYAGVAFTDAQIAHLADFCHEANPRFNRERWIGYIKGENGKNGGKPLPPRKPSRKAIRETLESFVDNYVESHSCTCPPDKANALECRCGAWSRKGRQS